MSNYNAQFTYKGKSNSEYGLIIVSFNGDNGDTDSFLDMESVQDVNYDGTLHHEYGSKYSSVATINITMIKKNYEDFTISDFRDVARWLTGSKMSSWLDIQSDRFSTDTIYSYLCKCINLQQYKLDGRVIGVIATFESLTPWAFSPLQCIQIINGTSNEIVGTNTNPFIFTITNPCDDMYSFVYPNVMITNTNADGSFSLTNTSLNADDVTSTSTCVGLSINEVIKFYSNHIITTDIPNKIIGDNFNWAWPKLTYGENKFEFIGHGKIIIAFRYPIKVGEGMLGNDYSNRICLGIHCKQISSDIIQTSFNLAH